MINSLYYSRISHNVEEEVAMRWSDSYPLSEYWVLDSNRDGPGIYEIGIIRGGIFFPKYIGKASKSIKSRLASHYSPNKKTGSKSIYNYLYEREKRKYKLWFHVLKCKSPSTSEARLLNKYDIGKNGGLYMHNRRLEKVPE